MTITSCQYDMLLRLNTVFYRKSNRTILRPLTRARSRQARLQAGPKHDFDFSSGCRNDKCIQSNSIAQCAFLLAPDSHTFSYQKRVIQSPVFFSLLGGCPLPAEDRPIVAPSRCVVDIFSSLAPGVVVPSLFAIAIAITQCFRSLLSFLVCVCHIPASLLLSSSLTHFYCPT